MHGKIRYTNTEFYSEILSGTRYLENLSVTVSKILNFAFSVPCLKFGYYDSNQRMHTVLLKSQYYNKPALHTRLLKSQYYNKPDLHTVLLKSQYYNKPARTRFGLQ